MTPTPTSQNKEKIQFLKKSNKIKIKRKTAIR